MGKTLCRLQHCGADRLDDLRPESGRDGLELGVELRADCRPRCDAYDGDQSGNQAILDGGRAGFVRHKTVQKILHGVCSYHGCCTASVEPLSVKGSTGTVHENK